MKICLFSKPLPPIDVTSKRVLAEFRMLAKQYRKAVPQSSLRQENCKFKSGTLPLGMYVTEAVKESLQFHPPIPDDDVEEEAEEEKPAPKGLTI